MKASETLHGELHIDEQGNAHFMCHTPGGWSFAEVKTGIEKFIAVLQDQLDREHECPMREVR